MADNATIPVVIWHGMGEFSISYVAINLFRSCNVKCVVFDRCFKNFNLS
jgi:hypothetical protein